MYRVFLAFVLSLSGFGLDLARAEEPVYFADATLQAAVEDELWIADPTPTDMLGLPSLKAPHRGIESVEGLQYAKNLELLIVNWNDIHDLTPLAGLTNLEFLNIHGNGVSDISALAGLTHLETLILHINRISDVSPLAGLTELRTLILFDNQISDISALSHLTNLQELDLAQNAIMDISPLVTLTHLTNLNLEDNPLDSETCAGWIAQIKANNPGIEIRHPPCAPRRLTITSTAGGAVVNPGEGEFLYETGTDVTLDVRADPGFSFAYWSGEYYGTEHVMHVTMDRDHAMRAHFVMLSSVIHVDDDAPADPRPGDPAVSDPLENGTREHPFDRVQDAIEVAGKGATIFVHAGTYRETIDLLGRQIELTGFDPNEPATAAWPVLDGAGTGPVVTCTGGEDAHCLLTGLVITAGQGRFAGAIRCAGSSPTIANCIIAGNRATESSGAAIYCTDSEAALVNCTIVDNRGGSSGAPLSSTNSRVSVVNSILWGNEPREVLSQGGEAPAIRYSIVAGGWPGPGNLSLDPLFAALGRWVSPGDPTVAVSPDDLGAVWLAGDYHLQSQAGRWDPTAGGWKLDGITSPGVDSGDPAVPVGPEPSPNGGIINLGAYGGTPEAGKSLAQGLSP